MENYVTDFIGINFLNQINKVSDNKKLLNMKKKQFGLRVIKIPKNSHSFIYSL